ACANFVVVYKPTADRHTAQSTTSKKLNASHIVLTSVVVPFKYAGIIIITKESPANINPNENFLGVDGWRFPSLIHIQANTGASRTIKIGLSDWNQDDCSSQPKKLNCVRSSAYSS